MFLVFLVFLSIAIVKTDDWASDSGSYEGTRNVRDHKIKKNTLNDVGVLCFFNSTPYGPISSQVTMVGDDGYVGSLFGRFIHFNLSNCQVIQTAVYGLITQGASVSGSVIKFGTIQGTEFAVNRFNISQLIWAHPYPGGNAIWTSMEIGNEVFVPINPLEEGGATLNENYYRNSCCTGRASVVKLDANTGAQIGAPWYTIPTPPAFINVTLPYDNIFDGVGVMHTTFPYGPSGVAQWGQFAYSPITKMIYGCLGQAASPMANGRAPPETDSCFGLHIGNLSLGWQTSPRTLREAPDDIYIFAMYYHTTQPRDMDIGNGPIVYYIYGNHGPPRLVVASCDKEGRCYRFDAYTGELIADFDTIAYVNSNAGLNATVYPTVDGGYNIQGAACRPPGEGGRWATFQCMETTFFNGTCNNTVSSPPSDCNTRQSAQTISFCTKMSDDGETLLALYRSDNTRFVGATFIINDEIYVIRDVGNKRAVFLDTSDLTVLRTIDLPLFTTENSGGHATIANGRIAMPTGPFGVTGTGCPGVYILGVPEQKKRYSNFRRN